MRRVLPLAMLLLLLAPAAAQQLEAAVAPAQTAVDAAAEIVPLAIAEAERDGSPDEAIVVRDQLLAFADALEGEWVLPENATYGAEALGALPYVQNVTLAVATLPEAVAPLARSPELCAQRALTGAEHAELRAAQVELNATALRLFELAAAPPEGVDTRALLGAAERLAAWEIPFLGLPGCRTETAPADFLTLTLRPTTVWPTGHVRVLGATSLPGPVRIESPAIGLAADLPAPRGGFALRHEVPEDAPLGTTSVVATVGSLRIERPLVVERAPSRLVLSGPARVDPGEAFLVTVRLESPLASITDTATVTVDGAPVALAGGRGTLRVVAPDAPQTLLVRSSYPGHRIVEPAEATLEVLVVVGAAGAVDPATTPTDATPPGPLGDGPLGRALGALLGLLAGLLGLLARGWALLAAIVAFLLAPFEFLLGPLRAFFARLFDAYPILRPLLWLLLLVVLLVAIWLVRRRAARASAATEAAPPATRGPVASALAAALPSGLVALVAQLLRGLRHERRIDPGTTARESIPLLRGMGIDAEEVVLAFERVRYGGEQEPETWRAAVARWSREAWTRLRGGDA